MLIYVCTVHKSQGGEYLIVVMPITNAHFIMLERNLLYTGVTRAKRALVIVGEKSAVAKAVSNNGSKSRYILLCERLQK